MTEQIVLQERLRKTIDQDLNERIQVHQQNIARLESARSGARNFAAAIGNRPLVLLAQGDSWFDYPLVGNGPLPGDTDVIAQLRRLGAMPPTILNLAIAGDTAVGEMSLRRQAAMIEQLRNPSNWIDLWRHVQSVAERRRAAAGRDAPEEKKPRRGKSGKSRKAPKSQDA